MLSGLIFRGIAFEFRFMANRSRYLWNIAFAGGSTLAAFAQGMVVGKYIEGINTADGVFVGGPLDFVTPFTLLTGVGLVAGYALLGSTWTVMKTEGTTQAWARRMAKPLLLVVLAVFGIISLWTPFVDESVRERWFSNLHLIWVLPALALFFAWRIWHGITHKREGTPFVATMGLFVFTYLGLLVSKWPYVVPPEITLYDAASAWESQLFLLLGLLFVIPIVLTYTAWTYWVFRGKVRAGDGYH
ncbi:MAG: cytochrome d ubiquinol oxidase subunit II, partial [Halospina sp.]